METKEKNFEQDIESWLLNEELVEKYKANILTETRQFFYSTDNKNSIDMAQVVRTFDRELYRSVC